MNESNIIIRLADKKSDEIPATVQIAAQKFISLDRQMESVRDLMKQRDAALDELKREIGATPFQDELGVVYQLTKPNGTFVYFKDIEAVRTRRPGEVKGTLSMKQAREWGFTVEGE